MKTQHQHSWPSITHQQPLTCLRQHRLCSNFPLDEGLSFKSLIQHKTAKVINQHRQHHAQCYDNRARDQPDLNIGQSVRIQNPTTKLWDPAIVTQKLAGPRSFEVETGNGTTYHRNRTHINATKDVCTKKHPSDDETEPLQEDTAITIPAPRPSVPPGVTMTRSGRIKIGRAHV